MTTCIVSAFYKIPSKMPYEWYLPKIINFFKSVRAVPVVFFTTPDVIEDVQKYTTTEHAKIVYLPFEDLNAFKKYGIAFWERQKSRDPQEYHTYQLGAVWYEKKEFVIRAVDIQRSEVYIWCDAGCVRDQLSCTLGAQFGTRTNYNINDNRMHIQKISEQSTQDFYRFDYKFVGGAIIAGNALAWMSYSELYDTILLKYDLNEVPAIMDQYIMKSCIDVRPELFVLYDQNSTIDKWFKFLELL
jgi:hypothetical protein